VAAGGTPASCWSKATASASIALPPGDKHQRQPGGVPMQAVGGHSCTWKSDDRSSACVPLSLGSWRRTGEYTPQLVSCHRVCRSEETPVQKIPSLSRLLRGWRLMALAGVIVLTGVSNRITWASEKAPGWAETAKIAPNDPAEEKRFGSSVSISGDTALIGTYLDDIDGTSSGSAYVVVQSEGVWTQQAKLVASDGELGDLFGRSVSIFGDTALVGASWDDDNGSNSGSAYIFVRSYGAWTQQAKLLPSDGAETDGFGDAVSISGDTALVGSFFSAYVFVRSGQTWIEQAKLVATDGANGFGEAVSISGDTALVGALFDDDAGSNAGSAYVFARSDGAWTQQAKLLPSDGSEEDHFGHSVALSDDSAIVGALFDGDNGFWSGSAYVFVRASGVWKQQAKLLPRDGAAFDWFGWSVSISGDAAVAGATDDGDNGIASGSVTVFTRNDGVWTEQSKLLPHDGATGDEFGYSVSISGNTGLVGAWLDDDFGSRSGAAYVFERDALSNVSLFTDGFESGDASAWSETRP